MKYIVIISLLVIVFSCSHKTKNSFDNGDKKNEKLITDTIQQKELFAHLMKLTNNTVLPQELQDSLAFLLLPVKASCPACRMKTIDSIDKHKNNLDDEHFVVIVGNGTKSINGFFRKQDKELPLTRKNIFVDTTNYSSTNDLTSSNPDIYYASQGKVYMKVSCMPNTIKGDLREFFKGL